MSKIGMVLALTDQQCATIVKAFKKERGELPLAAAMMLFAEDPSLRADAAAGRIKMYRNSDGTVEAVLLQEHDYTPVPFPEFLRSPKADAPSSEVDIQQPPNSHSNRVVQLCHKLREADQIAIRHDADDMGKGSETARRDARRILEEMGEVQSASCHDALAAVHFVRMYLMKDLVGEEFGYEERAVINQLDGLTQYLSGNMS
ncbi:hypothetical protein V5F29_10930 [Xanthobacter aminoxidans]|uniref:hypothetical protein n=1 Tax=Xanthobacter aminoxidans TaxID=186280 RepID=UPI00372C1921